ncbi:MAG: hypothetical protein ACYC5G_02785 [Candidatus Doudnabacteria bacterium]
MLIILAGLTYIQKVNHKNLFKRTDSLPGLLVQGFPDNLLLDFKSPKIVSSYSLDYSKYQKQYTTEFSLKENFFLIYTKYRTYLKQQGYYIANDQMDTTKFVAFLYGFKNESDINISITKKDKEISDLNITFLEKGGK